MHFNASRGKYENFHFDVLGSTLSLSQKSTEELCIIKLKINANFEEWMTCEFINKVWGIWWTSLEHPKS